VPKWLSLKRQLLELHYIGLPWPSRKRKGHRHAASPSLTLDLNLSRPPSDVKELTNALIAGCQRKAMGRTVVSQITMIHCLNLSVPISHNRLTPEVPS
jgi:hypothetical protein